MNELYITNFDGKNLENNKNLENGENDEKFNIITEVSLLNCPNITELPNWPNVKKVTLINCPNIIELPNWENVEFVNCSYGIYTKLPNWKNVKIVYCNSCKNLTKLPNWNKVVEIYMDHCVNISFFLIIGLHGLVLKNYIVMVVLD